VKVLFVCVFEFETVFTREKVIQGWRKVVKGRALIVENCHPSFFFSSFFHFYYSYAADAMQLWQISPNLLTNTQCRLVSSSASIEEVKRTGFITILQYKATIASSINHCLSLPPWLSLYTPLAILTTMSSTQNPSRIVVFT